MESLNNLIQATAGSSAPSFDAEDLEMIVGKMKRDTINALSELPRGYDCPICRNKGFVAFVREEGLYRGNVAMRQCSCKPIRRALRKMEQSGLGEALKKCTFDSFSAQKDWQKALKAAAEKYAREPEGWFALLGQSGCGKTHLCTAVCVELLKAGREVVYMSWRQEAGRIKGAEMDQREALLDAFRKAEVLYIDDLFKAGRDLNGEMRPTQADVNLAFTLLNRRYVEKKPTILSSELTVPELIDLDEALAGRMVERCGENLCIVGKDRGKNYRLNGMGKRF